MSSTALRSEDLVPGGSLGAALGDELDLLVTEGLIVSLEGGSVLLAKWGLKATATTFPVWLLVHSWTLVDL